MSRPRLRPSMLLLSAALLLPAACSNTGAYVGKWVGKFEVTDAALDRIVRGRPEQERVRNRVAFDTLTVPLDLRKDGTFFMVIFDIPMEGEWHVESGQVVARANRVHGIPFDLGEDSVGEYYYKVRRYTPDSTKTKLTWRDAENEGYEIHFTKSPS